MHLSNHSVSRASINRPSSKNAVDIDNIFELNKLGESKFHAYEIVDQIYNEIEREDISKATPQINLFKTEMNPNESKIRLNTSIDFHSRKGTIDSKMNKLRQMNPIHNRIKSEAKIERDFSQYIRCYLYNELAKEPSLLSAIFN